MRLDLFDHKVFSRAKPIWIEALWLVAQCLLVRSQIPGSAHRRFVLRLFGARIGTAVVIKPGVRIKFPWRLTVGDHSWLGEDAWIDNLADVMIGSHCCISQAAYLCTGNHDWAATGFDLRAAPIRICDGAWIAARSVVAPGVTIGEGSILAIGSVATRNLNAWSINAGSPATQTGQRPKRPSGVTLVQF
ncbi:WcaF family extracellular polysaccharide biosynthesis acetyltransferase [Hyphomicrobium sp.]|jgi:putative colanic acid biosynthesis acetyltransferase WcaF|uniref:WcaF family extracellular polysaccharide biosynthesis acetyltransferase n=1 Tax=Hyphomicrobium sp. TaxID=82 RepID=UPI0035668941